MLLLSELVGRDLYGPGGERLGTLGDLTVRLGPGDGVHVVDRVLVRRKRQGDVLLPWQVAHAPLRKEIHLAATAGAVPITSAVDALEPDEIRLVRDVLDTQIVDFTAERLARVADVVLARRGDYFLELVGVEVGFGAVLKRLGLGWLTSGFRADAVAWSDLHLASGRGHFVQLTTPRAAVHFLDARGLAALVARLDTESATQILTSRGPAVAGEVIHASHPAIGERMLRAMSDEQAADVVAMMPPHHATHWQRLLSAPRAFRGRHFLRSRVWPRRRLSPSELGH